jgi:hypothetical protein
VFSCRSVPVQGTDIAVSVAVAATETLREADQDSVGGSFGSGWPE